MAKSVSSKDGVQIIVHKLYGPCGHDLVGISDASFDGHSAITVGVRLPDGRDGKVNLSPIHGDDRKSGMTDIEAGTVLELYCPVCKKSLERIEDIPDQHGASYYALYRTPALSQGAMVLLSNVWGHYHSRVIDEFEVISSFADLDDALR
ncbi:MAG: hypothetical protein KC620_14515 [Myxococcales bacterium]|nr:hypothetical protein [Myxococcales bacterium]